MKNLTNIFWICLLALSFSACKKDNDNNASGTSQTQSLLVGKKWFVEKYEYIENGAQPEVEYPDDCESDDYSILNSNGTITEGTGVKICQGETNTGEVTKDKWALSSDNKTLIFTEDNCTQDCTESFTIESITSSRLVLYYEESETIDGVTYTYKTRIYIKS